MAVPTADGDAAESSNPASRGSAVVALLTALGARGEAGVGEEDVVVEGTVNVPRCCLRQSSCAASSAGDMDFRAWVGSNGRASTFKDSLAASSSLQASPPFAGGTTLKIIATFPADPATVFSASFLRKREDDCFPAVDDGVMVFAGGGAVALTDGDTDDEEDAH